VYYQLTDSFEVRANIDQCWQFFGDAKNLPRITPPWLGFSIEDAPPAGIVQDSVLNYTIRWCGIPIRWRTRIIDWSPPHQFIDLQVRGPYALWHHQHTFRPTESGVLCMDRVVYQLPVPVIRRVAHALLVKPQLIEIFNYRRKVIAEHLGWVRAVQEDVRVERI
jgi:ligand-binding SRPBCC domain-containing protein